MGKTKQKAEPYQNPGSATSARPVSTPTFPAEAAEQGRARAESSAEVRQAIRDGKISDYEEVPGFLGESESTDDDGQLTGDALKERAAELDIDGRSSMNADELRDAIEKAEQDQK